MSRHAALPSLVARHAVRSLHAELTLYPKPGLVSPHDNGSHDDMDAGTFLRSLFALRGYFADITQAGMDDADFTVLRALGIAAERRMLDATGGINTHRGAIFCLGLLCAAAGRARVRSANSDSMTAAVLRDALTTHWGDALAAHCGSRASVAQRMPSDVGHGSYAAGIAHRSPASVEHAECSARVAHGTVAAIVHGVQGARGQAAAGMPAVFEIALPVLRATIAAGRSVECARIDAFFSLLAVLDDTNVYHRGGAGSASLVRQQGTRFIAAGGTADPGWRSRAGASHRLLVQRRLSPGGVADMLAATCLVQALCAGGDQGSVAHPGQRRMRPALHDGARIESGADGNVTSTRERAAAPSCGEATLP